MSLQVSRELLFIGADLSRPRMAVEREKLDEKFPHFQFYASAGVVNAVKGYISTSYGSEYFVSVEIASTYPYSLPKALVPHVSLDRSCGHTYSDHQMCLMKEEQWSTPMSLALIVAKAAVWLNKYDSWIENGKRDWPGTEQLH